MKTSPTHIPSLLGALLFTVGAVFSLGAAVVLAVMTLGNIFVGRAVQARETILLTVIAFEGLLLAGAAYVSIQKFLHKPSADQESVFKISAGQIAACLVAAGIAIFLGHQLIDVEPVNWLLIPILTIPAVVLPILVLFGLGVRGIPLGPRWRTWNILGISMTLAPLLIFFLEALAIFCILVLAVFFLISQPDLLVEMERLAMQLQALGEDPEAIIELMAPLMLRPGVITGALLFFSVVVPLVEELVKPLGVLLFSKQISSPAQGFALGALSGAAYALIETLGVSPQSADWAALLLTRIGTDILHVTASALMGAGIIYAVRERRYLRLLGIYFLSVSMHGLWNALAMVFTFSTIADLGKQSGWPNQLTTLVTIGMALLALLYLILLLITNRRMRATIPVVPVEELVLSE